MWCILLVTCCALFSEIVALPTPQDYDFLPPFDVDSVGQGNLVPQGFSTPQRESRQVDDNGVAVTRYSFEFNELAYKYTYELADGTIRSEEGAYKDGVDEDGNPVKILVVTGAYSYKGPDGETYWTNYEADEGGYRPKTGKGVGGIKPGEDASIDPNLLKSLVG